MVDKTGIACLMFISWGLGYLCAFILWYHPTPKPNTLCFNGQFYYIENDQFYSIKDNNNKALVCHIGKGTK